MERNDRLQMCMQIPLKVERVENGTVVVESGRKLRRQPEQPVAPGDYIYAFGDLIVSTLPAKEGKEIRAAFNEYEKST